MNKNQKGITLIALVITIIVMLILVIVSIRIATTGGLFNKAGEAARETENAKEHEQELAEGKVEIGGKEYANIDDYFAGNYQSIDWEYILASATTPHPEQTESTDIGIGTDGELVNLDNWYYQQITSIIDGSGINLNSGIKGTPSYKGSFVNGKIEGTVPAYIKIAGGSFLPVISMAKTFLDCRGLTTAPTIPNSVTSMAGTFSGCTGLTTAPTIPNSVTTMRSTFSGCTGLTTAPTIPNSVTTMRSTFSGCTGLTTAPTIPNSVTNMDGTFSECTLLTTAPTIPNSVTSMAFTFSRCTGLTTAPTIPSSVTNMDETFSECTLLTTAPTIPNSVTSMAFTFSGCTGLTTAPTIPSSVTMISGIFKNCTNLQGTLTINATIEGTDTEDVVGSIYNCLYGATTADDISLIVTGSAPAETLQAIVAQANNEKITYVEPPVINPQPEK